MHVPSLVKVPWHLLKLLSGKWKYGCVSGRYLCQNLTKFVHYQSHPETKIWASWADNSVKNWRTLLISNPKPDLYNINTHTNFEENPLMFTQVIIRKRKMDGQTDRHTDVQQETIIPHHYHVAGIKRKKKVFYWTNLHNLQICKFHLLDHLY